MFCFEYDFSIDIEDFSNLKICSESVIVEKPESAKSSCQQCSFYIVC